MSDPRLIPALWAILKIVHRRKSVLCLGLLVLLGGRVWAAPTGSGLRVNPATSELFAQPGEGLPEILLGRLRFVTRRAAMGDEGRLNQPTALDAGTWKLTGSEGLGFIVMHAEEQAGILELSVDLAPLNRAAGLFRPVIELVEPGPPVETVTDGGTKSRSGRTVARSDLGFMTLAAEFDPSDVARTMVAPNHRTVISWRWHSKVVETAPTAPFVLRMKCEPRSPAEAQNIMTDRLLDRCRDLEARLAAWDTLLTPGVRESSRTVVDRKLAANAAITAARAHPPATLAAVLGQIVELRGQVAAAEETFNQLLVEHRAALRTAAKERFAGMHYRAGLAFDSDPAKEIDQWALYRMGLFRLAVNPVWHQGKDRATRTTIVRKALAAGESYGGRAVLSVYEEKKAVQPEDLTFTNEFMPLLRSGFHEFGFNSARLRNANLEDFAYWMKATAEFSNVESYKIDNEPFWSTQAYPVFGYDEATVGCTPETFQRAVAATYPAFADWRARIDGTMSEQVVPWKSWSEMKLAPGAARGLTFVQFLQQRYGSLARLNEIWGKQYTEWGQVFPPLPKVEKNRRADDSGAPEFDLGGFRPLDVGRPRPAAAEMIAWRDWIQFWPHNINDELREYVALARRLNVTTPITTNCVGGSTLNNSGDLVVANAMLPWITPDGLDAVAIDFYQPGYLQGYLRAITAAARGRPAEIHETGGSDTHDECWFMTAYAFAYGARGTLFWRRDQTMPPPAAFGLAQAIDVINHPDLQAKSTPATDGIALIYPIATLYGEEARTGTAEATLGSVQGALIIAHRQQWQFDFPADRDLGTALTDQVKVAIFPAASWLAETQWQAVQAFVARGGAVAVPADFALRDEHGRERPAAALAAFKARPLVHVFAESAFRDFRKTIRGPERGMQFGLTGANPDWAVALDAFVEAHASAWVRYRDDAGALLRTHAAVRVSSEAVYAFVDPWSAHATIECVVPVTGATDLKTGRDLPLVRTGRGVAVEVTDGATVVRFTRAPGEAAW